MPTRLRNLVINRVDLVDVGANLDPATGHGAHVMLWKRAPIDDESNQGVTPMPEDPKPTTPTVPEEFTKRLAEIEKALATVQAENAKLTKRAEDAETAAQNAAEAAKNERDARMLEQQTAVLKSFANLPVDPEKDAPIFKALVDALTPEHVARIMEILRAADAASTAISGERGTAGREEQVEKSAWAEIAKRAEKMIEADPKMTLPQAITRVTEIDPDLYSKHVAEMRKRDRVPVRPALGR